MKSESGAYASDLFVMTDKLLHRYDREGVEGIYGKG